MRHGIRIGQRERGARGAPSRRGRGSPAHCRWLIIIFLVKIAFLRPIFGEHVVQNSYMAMTQKTGMDRYAMIQTYLYGTKELHKWSQKISISSKGYGLGPWGYGTRVWIASGVWIGTLDFDGPVVTPVIFLWVKQCHKKPFPRKISILIGGMFTIPSHG